MKECFAWISTEFPIKDTSAILYLQRSILSIDNYKINLSKLENPSERLCVMQSQYLANI